MDKKIFENVVKNLAKKDYDSLREFVSTLKFEDAYKILNGYNLDNVSTEDGNRQVFFDVNYESIATTIYKEPHFGGCVVNDTVDAWVSELSSPYTFTF